MSLGWEMKLDVGTPCARGIESLCSQQLDDGSFPFGIVRPDGELTPCHRLFSTLTVLLAAGELLPAHRLAKACGYVLEQRRPDGLWHYDPDMDIPADVDDTACAMACLARFQPALVRASDADLLRTFWRPDGGPFETWAPSEDPMWHGRERDDAVVNANVALALRLLGAPLDATERDAVCRIIGASDRRSRYYCAPATVPYTALRAGLPRDAIPTALLRQPQPVEGAQALAQWICTQGPVPAQALDALLSTQQPDGGWAAEPWCGAAPEGWASPSIATALCVEALHHAGKH